MHAIESCLSNQSKLPMTIRVCKPVLFPEYIQRLLALIEQYTVFPGKPLHLLIDYVTKIIAK